MKAEEKIIVEISAKFAYFLEKNSIILYNDVAKDRLGYLIDKKKENGEIGMVKELKKIMADYEAQKKILKKSIEDIGILNYYFITILYL